MLTIHSNAESVINRFLDRINKIRPGGSKYDKAMSETANALLANVVQRIHMDGRAGDGGDIGQYSASPIYVNPRNSPVSFQPLGKTGKDTFAKTGQPHITKYFDQGYRGYRQQIGLPADKVVLTLRGDLRDGLKVTRTERGYGLGWSDDALYQLAQSLERKYQKQIWSATAAEKAEAIKEAGNGIKL
jgi:hypothetical protein